MAYEKRCVLCGEAITNPISPMRLEEEVIYWLMDHKPSLIPFIRDIGEVFAAFTHENTMCVITKRNVNVCPHCYCNEIFTWLLENKHEALAERFREQFNFELMTHYDDLHGDMHNQEHRCQHPTLI